MYDAYLTETPGMFTFYNKNEWRIALILFVSYALVYVSEATLLPASATLHPAVVPAICALFFGGLRLWPIVYLSALTALLPFNTSLFALIAIPISVTLQAVIGAHLLRAARVDPILRRFRDMLHLAITAILISAISPTTALVVSFVRDAPFSIEAWGRFYLASLFVFIILLPFALRWITKPRFARTTRESVEIVLSFGVLLGILATMVLFKTTTLGNIPLAYLLLMPLLWIALRLRPRFLTLALVSVALVSVANITLATAYEKQIAAFFNTELFLIVIAAIFLTITSIEEDRRVNTNLLHSQLATLQNAITRATIESRAKNDFIAILAHELRNPLAPIVSAIDFMKLKGPRDKEDRETLEIMADRMDVVRRLLDDLLDISRISEGKILLKEEVVELDAILQRALLSTAHHRKERHQNLIYKAPDKTLSLTGDATRLEQAFSNILTNASKYSSAGDTVSLTVRERDGFAEIEIADRGLGLSPHDIERIFLPFQQVAHAERSAQGLGIGLSLVRSFVEMHNGTVTAESEGAGTGSRFIVRLPLVPETSTDGSSVSARSNALRLPFAHTLTVLVADDNDAAAAGIGRLLELHGCRVIYAYNGRQAADKVVDSLPDVALIDTTLPQLDGFAVAREVRGQGYTGRLIALTGYSTKEVVAKSLAAGFESHIVKPARLADLKRVIPEIA